MNWLTFTHVVSNAVLLNCELCEGSDGVVIAIATEPLLQEVHE